MSKSDFKHYSYTGPVCEFDRIIDPMWTGETFAPTKKKALSNLAFQYKRETGRTKTAKIILPGKIVVVE